MLGGGLGIKVCHGDQWWGSNADMHYAKNDDWDQLPDKGFTDSISKDQGIWGSYCYRIMTIGDRSIYIFRKR
jgi:hypothetical protein